MEIGILIWHLSLKLRVPLCGVDMHTDVQIRTRSVCIHTDMATHLVVGLSHLTSMVR